jgi:hypothetical protein
MSRVDEERDAARVAARLVEQRRLEENKKKEKAQADSAFSRLVGGQKEEASARTRQQQAKESTAKSAIASMLEEAHSASADAAKESQHQGLLKQSEAATKGRMQKQGADTRAQANGRAAVALGEGQKSEADQSVAHTHQGRQSDASGAAARSSGRRADNATTSERLEERKEAGEASAGRAGAASKGKGDLKADSEGGGSQGQGGGSKDEKGGAGSAGMRFNPALMAPVPVAQPKAASGSERLRKIANELAQKIVDRVRVGTNAAGRVEFQIDLKSDVLSGLSVKVSSHQGKIKAVFSGNDKDVLKVIEEHKEALKSALQARGLTLEELKIEAKA